MFRDLDGFVLFLVLLGSRGSNYSTLELAGRELNLCYQKTRDTVNETGICLSCDYRFTPSTTGMALVGVADMECSKIWRA